MLHCILDCYTCAYIAIMRTHGEALLVGFVAFITESLTKLIITHDYNEFTYFCCYLVYSIVLTSIVTSFFKVTHDDRIFIIAHCTHHACCQWPVVMKNWYQCITCNWNWLYTFSSMFARDLTHHQYTMVNVAIITL